MNNQIKKPMEYRDLRAWIGRTLFMIKGIEERLMVLREIHEELEKDLDDLDLSGSLTDKLIEDGLSEIAYHDVKVSMREYLDHELPSIDELKDMKENIEFLREQLLKMEVVDEQ